MKTLIAYSTRWGSTRKTAELLARTLSELDGRQADLAAPPADTIEDREAKADSFYIDATAAKAGLVPVAKTASGGRMAIFGKEKFDSWDSDRIKAWAPGLIKVLR